MLTSLRYRLIASYIAVIFVCLFLAGSAVVIVLREYQQRQRLDRLADAALPVTALVEQLEQMGFAPQRIQTLLRRQADQIGVRIILTDRAGLVIEDTGGDLEGSQLRLPGWDNPERRPDSARPYYASAEAGMFMIAPRLGATSNYAVIVAVPQASVVQAWMELAPSLSLAAFASLFVSVLVALLMTRTIAGPLVEMTRASEEMARGRYAQSIAARGRDEVGRLARAFNEMARQVSTSDRTLRDFLANVSHELKTPLTSIQGFSEAMLDGTIGALSEYRSAASVINQEARSMRRLVDDLLTLSRIESGQIAMGDDVIDLDRVLSDAVRRTGWMAEGATVRVVLESAGGVGVRGDAHWLGQAFANLLDNALKHTPDGGRITVRVQPMARDGGTADHVVVSVHNTGSYIPPDDLPRVFERFFQVDRSRSGRGSGLGLAIVREVVQAHRGSVSATSDAFQGTTFSVRLPLHALTQHAPELSHVA